VTKFLTLREVDRLIDELDRSVNDADWRPPFARLRNGYMPARRVREVVQAVLRPLVLVVVLYFLMTLYTEQWSVEGVDHNYQYAVFAILLLNPLAQLLIFAVFPVLRREERVAALLRAFGADIPDDGANAGERLPPQIAVALEALEKANSPTGLRSSYEAVENWQLSPKTWNWVETAIFWLLALMAGIFGGEFGVPEFFRGAAFMFVAMVAGLYLKRLMQRGSIVRRVEEALGRWRHLVPAMQEAGP
jgi:hypothetical protein